MTVHYHGHGVTLHHGDCLDVLREIDACSVDAVVTDPPYGLEFMGKEWDRFKTDRRGVSRADAGGDWSFTTRPQSYDAGAPFQSWCEAWAAECLRVLKPGGHLLAFGGTRTWHRLACAIEDAGFEIRDSLCWLYGSGFPKSLDVSKAIDRAAGAEREVVGRDERPYGYQISGELWRAGRDVTAPATPDAARWQGWGTALKPAYEPIVLARKPLAGTVAGNVLAHGTGALNVDACRIGTSEDTSRVRVVVADTAAPFGKGLQMGGNGHDSGRWPANVILDEVAAAMLDEQSGDDDGPSRFMYTAKADAVERPDVAAVRHPTVKPLDLMRWLVRLVTPPGGLVLDPFAGSGTTAEACLIEGFRCITVEREADYLPLIVARITRRRDPVAWQRLAGDGLPTLFDHLEEA